MNNVIEENLLRKLARTPRWQIVYNRGKEINLNLFGNTSDFSQIQIMFLNYLEHISSLYLDLAMGEELLCEETINDWIRADAYLLYKRNKKSEEKLVGAGKTKSSPDSIVFV